MRLHCTKDRYLDRRPWGHGAEVYKSAKEAMKLRHALIPYIYTMAWRNHQESIPLITPMYYHYPEQEEAYSCPQQYYFGSELVVAPYLESKDETTDLSRQSVWLPEGDWFNFFTGEYYQGDNWYAQYGTLDEIPVFAKAGAIIPLGPKVDWGGVDNPAELELNIFPGADNTFELYEDEGDSKDYKAGEYATTKFVQQWDKDRLQFEINQVEGNTDYIPEERDYKLVFKGIKQPDEFDLKVDGVEQTVTSNYKEEEETLVVKVGQIKPKQQVTAILASESDTLLSKRDRRLDKCRKMLKGFRMDTTAKSQIEDAIKEQGTTNLSYLRDFSVVLTDSQIRALVELLSGVGIDKFENCGEEKIIIWNNNQKSNVEYQLSTWAAKAKHSRRVGDSEAGIVAGFKVFSLEELNQFAWELKVDYGNLVTVEYSN
ncbi:hypothetical protein JCM16358_14030 [Halanaerocella petrolearia]